MWSGRLRIVESGGLAVLKLEVSETGSEERLEDVRRGESW